MKKRQFTGPNDFINTNFSKRNDFDSIEIIGDRKLLIRTIYLFICNKGIHYEMWSLIVSKVIIKYYVYRDFFTGYNLYGRRIMNVSHHRVKTVNGRACWIYQRYWITSWFEY